MDRTVTRHATYTPFLLHCAMRRAPWRLLLLPFVAICDARLRAEAHRPREAEGNQPSPAARPRASSAGVEAAGRQLRRPHRRHRTFAPARARRLPATRRRAAAWSWRPPAIASTRRPSATRLGFDDVIGTGSIIGLDERVHAKIDGENCYGPAKLRMVGGLAREERLRARPRALLFRPCERRAGVRMGRRSRLR